MFKYVQFLLKRAKGLLEVNENEVINEVYVGLASMNKTCVLHGTKT